MKPCLERLLLLGCSFEIGMIQGQDLANGWHVFGGSMLSIVGLVGLWRTVRWLEVGVVGCYAVFWMKISEG